MGVSPDRWLRLCVDIDEQAHPVGSSYEVHQGDDLLRVSIGFQPGPFDTPAEVLAELLQEAERHCRLTLFPSSETPAR
jgi:hypothetical protein